MFWKRPTREDEENGRWLRQEALDGRVGFSDAIHQRLCEAIRKCDAAPSPVIDEPVRIRGGTYGWLVLATAASLTVAAATVWWAVQADRESRLQGDLPEVVEVPAVSQEQMPQTADAPPRPAASYPAPGEIVSLVDSTVTSSQWAYLDHDARVAWKLFAEVVPLRPTPQRSTH